METMVAWMVGNITMTNNTGSGWTNGTNGANEELHYNGLEVLQSMPLMKLADWVQVTAHDTESLSSRPFPSSLDGP